MSTVYKVYRDRVTYGRPGGTQLDFDVYRKTRLLKRFATRAEAEALIQRVRKPAEDYVEQSNGEQTSVSYRIEVEES